MHITVLDKRIGCENVNTLLQTIWWLVSSGNCIRARMKGTDSVFVGLLMNLNKCWVNWFELLAMLNKLKVITHLDSNRASNQYKYGTIPVLNPNTNRMKKIFNYKSNYFFFIFLFIFLYKSLIPLETEHIFCEINKELFDKELALSLRTPSSTSRLLIKY